MSVETSFTAWYIQAVFNQPEGKETSAVTFDEMREGLSRITIDAGSNWGLDAHLRQEVHLPIKATSPEAIVGEVSKHLREFLDANPVVPYHVFIRLNSVPVAATKHG